MKKKKEGLKKSNSKKLIKGLKTRKIKIKKKVIKPKPSKKKIKESKPRKMRGEKSFFGKIRAELFGNKKSERAKHKKQKTHPKKIKKIKTLKKQKTKIISKKIKNVKPLQKKILKQKPIVQPKIPLKKPLKKPVVKPLEPKQGFFGKLKTDLLGTKEPEVTPDKKIKKVVKQLKTEIHKKEIKKESEKDIQSPKKLEEKAPVLTGIKGFDALFGKGEGIPSGASVLVEGGPGSGKTLFCLTTLYNLCKEGKKCLYMSFEEPEERLVHHMENFGWDAKELIKKGLLRIKRFDAIDVSRSIEALLGAAKKELLIDIDPVFFPEDFEADFVVIDSLTSIASAFSGEDNRFRIYMEQLFRYLERNKITNFLIREVSAPSHVGSTFKEEGSAVSFLSDGIIVIYNVIYDSGERTSAIEILKMRGVDFQKKLVELKIIDKKGLEVNPNKILKKHKGKDFNLT